MGGRTWFTNFIFYEISGFSEQKIIIEIEAILECELRVERILCLKSDIQNPKTLLPSG
jgi:hypothetical protein